MQRSAFQSAYANKDASTYVGLLFQNAGVTPAAAETTSAINAFNGAGGGDAGRAAALRSVPESNAVSTSLFNEAFVLMQYFGYRFIELTVGARGAAASTPPFGDLQMRFLHSLILIIFLLLTAGSSFAQTHFLFEYPEPFKDPVRLPAGAVELLRREMQAASYCPNETAVPVESLRASQIDLGRDRLAFIVRSLHDCFNGPDHDRFWIVLHTPRGYELLLQAGTVAVTVRTERTRGFPDIETNAASPEGFYREVYKFNGSVYKASLCTRTTLSTSGRAPLKAEPVTCRTH